VYISALFCTICPGLYVPAERGAGCVRPVL
jgi:hypothetical protein